MATMPNNATLAESAKLRERGNNLFSAGNLVAGELPSRLFSMTSMMTDTHAQRKLHTSTHFVWHQEIRFRWSKSQPRGTKWAKKTSNEYHQQNEQIIEATIQSRTKRCAICWPTQPFACQVSKVISVAQSTATSGLLLSGVGFSPFFFSKVLHSVDRYGRDTYSFRSGHCDLV